MLMVYRISLQFLIFLVCYIGIFNDALAQEKKKLTLEDIYKNNLFSPRSIYGINWMADGQYYTSLVSDKNADYILKYNIKTGEVIDTVLNGRNLAFQDKQIRVNGYSFNADESQLLLATEL